MKHRSQICGGLLLASLNSAALAHDVGIAASPGWSHTLPPGPDTRVKITAQYAKHVARDAFFWAWPLVNIYNKRRGADAVRRARLCRPRAVRAAQSHRDAYRLRRRGGTHCRLPQLGRCLRRRIYRPRAIAGRHTGAGIRRPVLGLSGGRSAQRQLHPARQDVRHHTRLLSAGWAELAWASAKGHCQCFPRLYEHRLHCVAHLHGRHRGRSARNSAVTTPGHDVPACRI